MKTPINQVVLITSLFVAAAGISSQVFAGEGKACDYSKKGENKSMMKGHHMDKAQAKALVQPFYDLLGGDTTPEKAKANFAADWKSYSGEAKYRGLDDTIGFVSGPLQKMIPDLNWEIVNISLTNDHEIVVRGKATGTPVGEKFFGQPVSGKSFEMMSIDVHKVQDGKIIHTYHVEDWRGALEQLAAK